MDREGRLEIMKFTHLEPTGGIWSIETQKRSVYDYVSVASSMHHDYCMIIIMNRRQLKY